MKFYDCTFCSHECAKQKQPQKKGEKNRDCLYASNILKGVSVSKPMRRIAPFRNLPKFLLQILQRLLNEVFCKELLYSSLEFHWVFLWKKNQIISLRLLPSISQRKRPSIPQEILTRNSPGIHTWTSPEMLPNVYAQILLNN